MSNSALCSYKNISAKSSARYGNSITRIIVHHMACISTAKACCDSHKNSNRQVSSTYYIGKDGDIAQGVDESRRPWTSGSFNADKNAVTIEVSNSATGGDWKVSNASYKALVKLCADICKRNGIKALTYTGNRDKDSLSCHRQWDATACPGDYLYGQLPQLCTDVNNILNLQTETKTTKTEALYRVRKNWKNEASQIGAFKTLASAKALCDRNVGYSVFNGNGVAVYTNKKKTVIEIAKEVVAGKWGNGTERKQKLTEAGYDYEAVQKAVNKLLK